MGDSNSSRNAAAILAQLLSAGPPSLNLSALQRGDVLTVEMLERITGEQRGTDKYRLAAMYWVSQIHRHFDGKVSVRLLQDAIHVLNPQEQDEFAQSDEKYCLRRLRRRVREDEHNDVSRLTDEQLSRRDDRLHRMKWILQQARRKKLPKLEDKRRREKDS